MIVLLNQEQKTNLTMSRILNFIIQKILTCFIKIKHASYKNMPEQKICFISQRFNFREYYTENSELTGTSCCICLKSLFIII